MKYDDMFDMDMLDKKAFKLANIVNAANAEKNQDVREILWDAYDNALEELIELIGTQWCESMKEVKR